MLKKFRAEVTVKYGDVFIKSREERYGTGIPLIDETFTFKEGKLEYCDYNVELTISSEVICTMCTNTSFPQPVVSIDSDEFLDIFRRFLDKEIVLGRSRRIGNYIITLCCDWLFLNLNSYDGAKIKVGYKSAEEAEKIFNEAEARVVEVIADGQPVKLDAVNKLVPAKLTIKLQEATLVLDSFILNKSTMQFLQDQLFQYILSGPDNLLIFSCYFNKRAIA